MLASEEEKKVQIINEDVAKKQKACEDDLLKAEPALIAARKALDSLNKVLEFLPFALCFLPTKLSDTCYNYQLRTVLFDCAGVKRCYINP